MIRNVKNLIKTEHKLKVTFHKNSGNGSTVDAMATPLAIPFQSNATTTFFTKDLKTRDAQAKKLAKTSLESADANRLRGAPSLFGNDDHKNWCSW